MAQPLASAFIFSTFPPKEQGTALGVFGIALVAGPAFGPILGGYLVDINLWQWIFFINVPIGILGVTLAARWLRERRNERRPKADPLGLITATIGFGAVLYAATRVAEEGWSSGSVVTSFVVGGIALMLFTQIELFVAEEPLLNLRLFGRPTFLLSSLIGYVSVIGLLGAAFLMPLYLQVLRGRSALETGVILLPLALTAAVTTPIAGRLYDKIGPRLLLIGGFGVLLINTWQLSMLNATTSISTILILLALRGIALGMTVQTTFATALGAVPKQNLARGSSLINGTRFVVQLIGVAMLATVLSSALSPTTRAFQDNARSTTTETVQTGTTTAQPTTVADQRFGICETPGVPTEQNVPAGVPTAAAPRVRGGIQQACSEYVNGFEATYNVTFYFALIAMIIGGFLPGWPLKWAGRGAAVDASPAPAHSWLGVR